MLIKLVLSRLKFLIVTGYIYRAKDSIKGYEAKEYGATLLQNRYLSFNLEIFSYIHIVRLKTH